MADTTGQVISLGLKSRLRVVPNGQDSERQGVVHVLHPQIDPALLEMQALERRANAVRAAREDLMKEHICLVGCDAAVEDWDRFLKGVKQS